MLKKISRILPDHRKIAPNLLLKMTETSNIPDGAKAFRFAENLSKWSTVD